MQIPLFEKNLIKTLTKLRPLCVKLVENLDKNILKTLINVLEESEADVLCELQEYVLFPLVQAFNKKNL